MCNTLQSLSYLFCKLSKSSAAPLRSAVELQVSTCSFQPFLRIEFFSSLQIFWSFRRSFVLISFNFLFHSCFNQVLDFYSNVNLDNLSCLFQNFRSLLITHIFQYLIYCRLLQKSENIIIKNMIKHAKLNMPGTQKFSYAPGFYCETREHLLIFHYSQRSSSW